MMITLSPIGGGKGGDHILHHDLNFGQEEYEHTQKVTFKNPKPDLMERLKETGPVPGEGANGVRGAGAGSAKKRKANNVDMDKLAEGLQQLGEDELLHVVQMVHEQKATDTYTKNDVESEFDVYWRRQGGSRTNRAQMASSTSIYTHFPTASSSRCGTLRRAKQVLRLRSPRQYRQSCYDLTQGPPATQVETCRSRQTRLRRIVQYKNHLHGPLLAHCSQALRRRWNNDFVLLLQLFEEPALMKILGVPLGTISPVCTVDISVSTFTTLNDIWMGNGFIGGLPLLTKCTMREEHRRLARRSGFPDAFFYRRGFLYRSAWNKVRFACFVLHGASRQL